MKALCILSWKSHKILDKTLKTYAENNLFDFFDEVVVFLQEATQDDIAIAKKYNLSYLVTKKNIGIDGAWRKILTALKSQFVLMLEDDCPLIENNNAIKVQLKIAEELLKTNRVNIVRLRSIEYPGDKFNTIDKYRYYFCNSLGWIKRIFRPLKAARLIGSAIYSISNPDEKHPNEIKRHNQHCYITNSSHLNWTNQSVMFNKNFVLHVLLERVRTHPSSRTLNGFQDIERALNCSWWRKSKFPIAVCTGLFTHRRVL